jgi:hypothetical protein
MSRRTNGLSSFSKFRFGAMGRGFGRARLRSSVGRVSVAGDAQPTMDPVGCAAVGGCPALSADGDGPDAFSSLSGGRGSGEGSGRASACRHGSSRFSFFHFRACSLIARCVY